MDEQTPPIAVTPEPIEHPANPPPLPTIPFFDRTDWWGFGITTFLALSIYLFTLAPEVTLGDAGVYSTSAFYLGVPEPPGYPVWTIYSWLFTVLLPISNIAWRVGVAAATAAAVASGITAMLASRCSGALLGSLRGYVPRKTTDIKRLKLVCGCVAGMAFAFDRAVWGRAVIAGPWPVTFALFAFLILLLARWQYALHQMHWLYAAFLTFGLILTNMQFLIVAAPGVALFIVLQNVSLGRDFLAVATILLLSLLFQTALLSLPAAKQQVINVSGIWPLFAVPEISEYFSSPLGIDVIGSAFVYYAILAVLGGLITICLVIKSRRLFEHLRTVCACGFLFLLALLIYLYLPVASAANPPMNWGYPRTVDGFYHVLSRGQFERIDPTNIIYEPGRFLTQLKMYWQFVSHDFGVMYLLLAAIPLCVLRRTNPEQRRLLIGLAGIFVCVSLFMLILLNPSSDKSSWDLEKVYFATSHMIIAIFAGVGLSLLGTFITGRFSAKST